MAGPLTGTCSPWATADDLCSPCDDYDNLSVGAEEFLQAASDFLNEASGGQFPGECPVTVRPCARRYGGYRRMDPAPPGWSRGWGVCGCSTDRCSCGGLSSVELGYAPIISIDSVTVDGVELDEDRYRVDDFVRLVRLADADGSNPGWPRCQDLSLPSTEDGTWEVELTWGRMPPQLGVTAAAVLACELALSCNPETQDKCRLPKNATSVTREGLTIVMSPSDFLDKNGKTGLYEVDLFLRAVNPERARRSGTVWTPTMDPASTRVDT